MLKTQVISMLFALSLTLQVNAGFVVENAQKVEAVISNRDINRIKVKNDRIIRIIGTQELFYHDFDETTGQVFIKPKQVSSSMPFTVVIITESGRTIDLNLKPTDTESASIILTEQKPKKTAIDVSTKKQQDNKPDSRANNPETPKKANNPETPKSVLEYRSKSSNLEDKSKTPNNENNVRAEKEANKEKDA